MEAKKKAADLKKQEKLLEQQTEDKKIEAAKTLTKIVDEKKRLAEPASEDSAPAKQEFSETEVKAPIKSVVAKKSIVASKKPVIAVKKTASPVKKSVVPAKKVQSQTKPASKLVSKASKVFEIPEEKKVSSKDDTTHDFVEEIASDAVPSADKIEKKSVTSLTAKELPETKHDRKFKLNYNLLPSNMQRQSSTLEAKHTKQIDLESLEQERQLRQKQQDEMLKQLEDQVESL